MDIKESVHKFILNYSNNEPIGLIKGRFFAPLEIKPKDFDDLQMLTFGVLSVLTTDGWFVMKVCINIHVAFRMNPNYFDYPLTFHQHSLQIKI